MEVSGQHTCLPFLILKDIGLCCQEIWVISHSTPYLNSQYILVFGICVYIWVHRWAIGSIFLRRKAIWPNDNALQFHSRHKNTCNMKLVADHLFMKKFVRRETAIDEMVYHYQAVEYIFRNQTFNTTNQLDSSFSPEGSTVL